MIKRILLLLMVASVALMVSVAFEDCDYREKLQREAVLESIGTAFSVPDDEAIDKSQFFWPLIVRVADQYGVNVFRKTSGFGSEGTPWIAYYALIAAEDTDFYEFFRLREGRRLTSEDSKGGFFYLSSELDGEFPQIGVLDDFGRNDRFSINGMKAVFDVYPVAGTYYVEAGDPSIEAAFISAIEECLVEVGADDGLGVPEGIPQEIFTPDPYAVTARIAMVLAIAAVMLMVIYRQYSESKRSAILVLYGGGWARVWLHTSGMLIIAGLSISTLGCCLAALLIPGTTSEFASAVFSNMATIAILLLVSSLSIVPITKSMRLQEALKDKKSTRLPAAIIVLSKTTLCIMLIYSVTSSISWYDATQEKRAEFGSWERTSQYGIFYPFYGGNDASESRSSITSSVVFDLYPILDEEGALFVEASEYSSNAIKYETPYRYMRVNTNYLAEYPVVDEEGDVVDISKEERDWILLVPEQYRPEESEIVEFWNNIRLGKGGAESVWEADLRIFGRSVSDPPRRAKRQDRMDRRRPAGFFFQP